MSRTKRVFDFCSAAVGLLILSPLLVVLTIGVYLEGGAPIFFRQQRVGRWGRPFLLWKFRTMVLDADRIGGQLTIGCDSRITRLGRLLRVSKLDELPQLFHVLRGTMSLVGPRPEVPRYVALYNPEQREVLSLTPGITDPASIAYRDEARLLGMSSQPERLYIESVMPAKIAMNLEYARRATVRSDIAVIFRTLAALLVRYDSRYSGSLETTAHRAGDASAVSTYSSIGSFEDARQRPRRHSRHQ